MKRKWVLWEDLCCYAKLMLMVDNINKHLKSPIIMSVFFFELGDIIKEFGSLGRNTNGIVGEFKA